MEGCCRLIIGLSGSAFLIAGEVSLPGGKAEEGDKDDGDTATREAKEEIGLDPSQVDVVNVLEPFLSKVCKRIFSMLSLFIELSSFLFVLEVFVD